MSRYVSIWFPHLRTDWHALREPHLHQLPFVLRSLQHNRMVVSACNAMAQASGIQVGMPLADARAIVTNLHVKDDAEDLPTKLLTRLATWCIRFSPTVAVDVQNGLLIDATGCTHLWGGEEKYVFNLIHKLRQRGYTLHAAMADTIGHAWGLARHGGGIVPAGKHLDHLLHLPPAALRLDPETNIQLHKLGLQCIGQIFHIPRTALRKRFGTEILQRLDQALGHVIESLTPVIAPEPYQHRLPCLEPVKTPTAIAIALQQLLEELCLRLQKESKGLRTCTFSAHRIDGKVEQLKIGTHQATHHVSHLFKLFEPKLTTIDPAWGIDLFILEATGVEACSPQQEVIWDAQQHHAALAELIDRLTNKAGDVIHRYEPAQHHWPERSIAQTKSLHTQTTPWPAAHLRPVQLLAAPDPIEVTAPIPDYPPMLFRYKGQLHHIIKADGPERIEQEWWITPGLHRDYYRVEDESGKRYWLFRLGHYQEKTAQWFLHGFFA